MKTIEVVFATTHLDSHGERMSKDTLERMALTMREKVVPFGIEHDPRIPPVGRAIEGHVEPTDDSEYQLVGTVELFESGDAPELFRDRRMPHENWDRTRPKITFDRNFQNERDLEIIREIGALLGSQPEFEIKKAHEPLSILTLMSVGGVAVAGGIAGGFLKQVGADAYNLLKEKIKVLMSRPKEGEKERLFVFKTTVKQEDNQAEVLVIFTNPTPAEIDDFFAFGLSKLDAVLPPYCGDLTRIQKLVLEPDGSRLKVVYAVRTDAVPLFPSAEDSGHSQADSQ